MARYRRIPTDRRWPQTGASARTVEAGARATRHPHDAV